MPAPWTPRYSDHPGYVTVFQEGVIRHYQTHHAGRRAVREYRTRPPLNGPNSKSTSINAGSSSATAGDPTPPPVSMSMPASGPLLQVDPVMPGRLDEIKTDLITRRGLAETKGCLGELEGIDLTLRFRQEARGRATARQFWPNQPRHAGHPHLKGQRNLRARLLCARATRIT